MNAFLYMKGGEVVGKPGIHVAADERRASLPEATSAPVVIYRSGITDTRPVTRWLDERGVGYREVVMGMGDARNRERFHHLQRATGWSTLPQIFVEGRFVGGLDEFLSYPVIAATAAGSGLRGPRVLGYLGVLPFAAGALALWSGAQPGGIVERLLVGYGAVILTFLGAVHWGSELAAPRREARAFAAAVVPALVGWATLALPAVVALPVHAGAFLGVLGWEMTRPPAGPGYMRLRARLTLAVVAMLAAAWAATLIR